MSNTYNSQGMSIVKMFLDKGLKPLGYGCNKATFVRGNYIFKIAKHQCQIVDIILEHMLYQASNKGVLTVHGNTSCPVYIHLAKCRLFFINKFPVLIMEKLIPVDSESTYLLSQDNRNEWMQYIGDGRQVGKDKFGKYKAFDFGGSYNLSELSWEAAKDYSEEVLEDMGVDTTQWSDNTFVDECYLGSIGMEKSFGSPSKQFVNNNKNILKFV